nr:hypothetical protein [Tanacetum cinerariifolium]
FEDCSDNNINEVNAAGTIVPTIGQNSPNSTNTFSVVGRSSAAASSTYGKSSFIDASQLPDDPHMPKLEDITYSDDEDDVGSGPTWLFDIDSLTRTINYQPVTAGNQTNPNVGFQDKFDAEKAGKEIDQQYMLFIVWSFSSTNPQNNDGDATFDGKEHDFNAKKPESEVSVSLSSSAQVRKQDDKTKKEAKRKSHVEYFTGYRNLSAEFEDCSDNNINEVNAAGTIVPTIGQNSPNSTSGVNVASTPVTAVRLNSTNSTNIFSAAGPSNNAVSLNFKLGGKSSYVDPSQYPDDPDMPALEDITYSDDEEDVGAEVDFSNLETNINVRNGPSWLFDIDALTQSMNYQPVVTGNQPNSSAGIQEHFDADKAGEENVQQYVLFPL